MFKSILMGIGALVLFLAFIFGMNLFGLASYSFFAPKYRAAENHVFKESEQYNDGMQRDFDNLMLQYQTTTDESQKLSIRSLIIHRFAAYNIDKLNSDQRQFYFQLKAGK
jgi:hypothetical protein